VEERRAIDLEARVRRLERENRRWKLAALLGAAGLALVPLWGPASLSAVAKGIDAPALQSALAPEVVEARRFVLRDASGVSRATLGVADDGTPLLVFYNGDGEPRAVLGQTQVYLSSDGGGTAVKLLANAGGIPALRLERDGRLRAVLGMTGDGALALGFYGQDGKGRALLDVGADGSPGLTLFTKSGKVAWSAP
jgi:hypothetical protein